MARPLLFCFATLACSPADRPGRGDGPPDADTAETDTSVPDAGAAWDVLVQPDAARGCDATLFHRSMVVTAAGGVAVLEVEVDDLAALHIDLALEGEAGAGLSRVFDPTGALRLDATDTTSDDFEVTDATNAFHRPSALNWPVRAEDGPLIDGVWRFEYTLLGAAVQDADVVFEVFAKRDPDLSRGCMDVQVVIDADLWAEPGTPALLEVLLDQLGSTWSSFGIAVQTEVRDAEMERAPGPPGWDERGLYDALSQDTEPWELLVVISREASGAFAGVTSTTPGTFLASNSKGALVPWNPMDWEGDGHDALNLNIGANVVAHELGHCAGLDHPTEFDEAGYADEHDQIADTEECPEFALCSEDARNNLMFPSQSVSEPERRTRLTPGQLEVLHRYTAVR